jgi:hypothetical protein
MFCCQFNTVSLIGQVERCWIFQRQSSFFSMVTNLAPTAVTDRLNYVDGQRVHSRNTDVGDDFEVLEPATGLSGISVDDQFNHI